MGIFFIACKKTEVLIEQEKENEKDEILIHDLTEQQQREEQKEKEVREEPNVVINIPLPTEITPSILVEIPDGLNEISGMIYHNQESVYGHNDSGGGPVFSDFSLTDKTINKTIEITNATNKDWEDFAQDNDFIYVADVGNNWGKRKDLRLYKVAKTDIASSTQVTSDIIDFQFSDQTDFSSRPDHNFNCEAVISFNDQLYLFSKNHGDFKTKCYTLSKNAGEHIAELKNEFDVGGLVTAATVSNDKKTVALLGYNEIADDVFEPFLWLFYDFDGDDFFSGKSRKLDITFQGQMESLCFGDGGKLYFASETESGLDDQYVYYFNIAHFLND